MQQRKHLLSAATLSSAMLLSTVAVAADLPKEGTFSVTYFSYGAGKSMQLAKERWFAHFEDHGLTVGSGLLDHMSWHCWGVADGANSIARFNGWCVLTDPAGDQIASDFASDEKVDLAKTHTNGGTFSMGTGKYAGISGRWTYTSHGSEFKTPEGEFLNYGAVEGSYKLP